MKLVHPNFCYGFDFEKESFYSLVIENADEYYDLTKQIIMQAENEDGQWVLSDILPINFSKKALVLYDFYNLSCNNKKMEGLLKNKILNLNSHIDLSEKISKVNQDIIELSELIVSNLDFNIDYNNEINLETLLKIIKFEFGEQQNLLEKILRYIEVYCELVSIKLVVLIGLTAILNEKDIEKIIKEINYKDIKILFIDSYDKNIFKKENKIIIDKDLCLI